MSDTELSPSWHRLASRLLGTDEASTTRDLFPGRHSNRAEIAVRAFRAAYELGARTVAVFPHEDRNSEHRLKADESYPIGEPGHPVRAYLDIAEIIRVARDAGADAVYPGYGFLSENPELARACAAAGITFVGPPHPNCRGC